MSFDEVVDKLGRIFRTIWGLIYIALIPALFMLVLTIAPQTTTLIILVGVLAFVVWIVWIFAE